MIQLFARTKLVEKGIEWQEAYTEKTAFLKEQFEDTVGPGSYFRFEGYDPDGGHGYYVIIGPANIHKPRAKFFAGVRKLPATYSAGGKYFDSLDGAAKYAKETWGVKTPKTLRPYTAAALYGLAAKIEKWKSEKGREDFKAEKDKEGDSEKSTDQNEVKDESV